jgi:hypothetical protein
MSMPLSENVNEKDLSREYQTRISTKAVSCIVLELAGLYC